MKRETKKITSSPKKSLDFLIKTGIFLKEGSPNPVYYPEIKIKGSYFKIFPNN